MITTVMGCSGGDDDCTGVTLLEYNLVANLDRRSLQEGGGGRLPFNQNSLLSGCAAIGWLIADIMSSSNYVWHGWVVDKGRKSSWPDMSGIAMEDERRTQRDTVRICSAKEASSVAQRFSEVVGKYLSEKKTNLAKNENRSIKRSLEMNADYRALERWSEFNLDRNLLITQGP